MLVTLEDESANANLIIWPTVFEEHRRIILSATMFGCRGRVQNAIGVIHLIVEHVADLSADLKAVSGSEGMFPLVAGRGDEAKHGGGGLDSREPKVPVSKPRDMPRAEFSLPMADSGHATRHVRQRTARCPYRTTSSPS
jgi:error-prone DNA polymerase